MSKNKKLPDKIQIWNILHDGSIEKISGTLPELAITVSIQYLRHIFGKDGESIIVKVSGCKFIEFESWDKEKLNDLNSIAKLEPEIVSVSEEDDGISIMCVDGVLTMNYEDVSYELDNGKVIAFSDLENACKKYWEGWRKKHSK